MEIFQSQIRNHDLKLRSVKMIDGSEKRNPRGQLAFELQNNHVCEKRSKKSQPFSRILSTFKRSFSKKMGKNTELTHYSLARR